MLDFPISPTDGQLFDAPNGVIYQWNSTDTLWNDLSGSTSTTPPTPVETRVIYVEDYGAVGDGKVDDTAAIQAAIDAATGERNTIEFSAGSTYKISDIINITRSNITVKGNGATVNGLTSPIPAEYDSQCAFLITGAPSATVATVTAPIVSGSASVTCATTGFAADDVVFIASSTQRFPSGSTDYNTAFKGEMHRVRSASAGVITLMDGAYMNYDATTTTVTKFLVVNDVVFEDLYVIMGGDNKAHCGVRFMYVTDCWWRGGGVKDSEETNIRFAYSMGGGVVDADVSGARGPVHGNSYKLITGAVLSPAGTMVRLTLNNTTGMVTGERRGVRGVLGTTEANGTWVITVIDATHIDLVGTVFANVYTSGGNMGTAVDTGYGVAAQYGVRDFVVRDCAFRDNKHSVTGGGKYPTILVSVLNNSVDGSRVDPQGGYDLENHEECLYWTFSGNKITGSNGSSGSGGLMVRGQWSVVSNNHLISPWQYGIYIKSFDNNNPYGMQSCTVVNNVVLNPRIYGIFVAGETVCTHNNVVISGNHIFSSGSEGIRCNVLREGVISDNTLVSCGFDGTAAIAISGNPPVTLDIKGAVNNGSGLVRLTVVSNDGLTTGMSRHISGVVGTTEANGQRTITIPAGDTTHIDLQGTTFVNAYVSGGQINAAAITSAAKHPTNTTIRLTVTSAAGIVDAGNYMISGVVGTTEANGVWEVDYVDATHVDLLQSKFVNAYSSGGFVGQTEDYCSNVVIDNNTIKNAGTYGLHAMYAKQLSVTSMNIRGTTLGAVRYENCSYCSHTGGTIQTTSGSQAGLLYQDCVSMALTGGTFENLHPASTAAAVVVTGNCNDIVATSYVAKGYFRAYSGASTSSNLIVSLVNGRQCLNGISMLASGTNINLNNL